MPAPTCAHYVRIARIRAHLFRIAVIALVFLALLSKSSLAQPEAAASRKNPSTSVAGATPAIGIIPVGSSLTFGGANAPDTYSATTTFSSTPVLVDNGAVKIWQEQVPTGSNGEWDIFHLETTNGGPLAGDSNAEWNIVLSYDLSAAVSFDAVVNQWAVSGTPVSPLSNGIGTICCAASSNPILPGESYYNSGFNGPLPAGIQTNWQQVFVRPYSLVSEGGVNPSTANQFTFALHFTLQAAMPSVLAAVSASAFGEFPTFAPGSWIEIYGTNLSGITQTWGSSDFDGVNGPMKLGGTSVTIGGQLAFVDYISPIQVNVQVPGGVTTGPQPLVVNTAAGASAPFTVTVEATKPGMLAPPNFKIGGTQYVVAQFADGSYVLPPGAIAGHTSQRAHPDDTIVIYGIGFGSVDPGIPPGQLVGQLNTLAEPFTISIGGTQAKVAYDGLASGYMGLYQFNVVVPTVAAGDTVPLTFTLGGDSGTQTLSVAIGN